MRFMGDYPLARNQTEIDCVFYLLKVRIEGEICESFIFFDGIESA